MDFALALGFLPPSQPSTHIHTLTRTIFTTQLVELKNGETFNGHLVNCDNFMNITLREVYQTSADADRFWKMRECYIRGSTVSAWIVLFYYLILILVCLDLMYFGPRDLTHSQLMLEHKRSTDR